MHWIIPGLLLGFTLDLMRWLRWRRLQSSLGLSLRRPLPMHLLVWAVLCGGALALLPREAGTPVAESPAPLGQLQVMVLLDASWSMTAGSRWQQAEAGMQTLLDQLPPHWTIGLVTFAGSADPTCPPTLDRRTLRHFLSYRAPDMMPDPGSLIEPALAEIRDQLGDPPRPNKKEPGGPGVSLILISDGEWEDLPGANPYPTLALQIGSAEGEELFLPGGEPLESSARPDNLKSLTGDGPVLIPEKNPQWSQAALQWLQEQAKPGPGDITQKEEQGLPRPGLALWALGLLALLRFSVEREDNLP